MKVLIKDQSVWVNMETTIPYSEKSKLVPIECKVIEDYGNNAKLLNTLTDMTILVGKDRIFESYNLALKDCAI